MRIQSVGLLLGALGAAPLLAVDEEPVILAVHPASAEARETLGEPYDIDVLTGLATSHEVGWIPSDNLTVGSLERFADLMPHITPLGELMSPPVTQEITARRVVEMTLANSVPLRAAGYTVRIRQLDVPAARGDLFDTVFTASASAGESDNPSSSTLAGGSVVSTRRYSGNVGLSQRLATGALVDLAFSITETRTNNTFATLNPADSTDISVSLTQPLLDGFGPTVTRAPITRAALEADAAVEDYRDGLMSTLVTALNAHWDLHFARQQAGVRLLSLEQARVVLNNNRIRQRVGDMTRADVLQAESVVAQREGDYYNAMLSVKDAEDALWFQIEQTADSWDVGLIPTDSPTLEVLPFSAEQLVATALQHRPDLIAAFHRHAREELDRRVARNALLPELNLTATAGFQGLGGEPTSSLSLLGTLDFEDWVVGLSLRHPLQNRAARSRLRQAELSVAQSETNIQALRLQITLEVRNAVRRVQNALDLLAAREAEVRARELDLHDEARRFEFGLSTTDTLLDFQDDLASARINRLAAAIEYEKAIIALEEAIGRLLERWGVVIEPSEGRTG